MRYAAVIVLLFVSLVVQAQDPHFSQFYVSPLLQNPANTGYFNCDYRFTAIYRNQWKSITTPYKTFAASYDMRFIRNIHDGKEIKHTKDIIGAGLVLLNDKSGDGGFSRLYFGAAGSMHKSLDRYGRNYFGFGLMLAYGSANIDFNKLTWPDQYSYPNGPLNPTQETPFSSYNFFDMSGGVEINHFTKDKQQHFQLGAAVYHLNRPRQSFYRDNGSRLPIKYVLHGSAQFTLSKKVELYPKLNYSFQRAGSEIMVGSFARIDLKQTKSKDYGVYLGTWVRIKDAVIPVVRFDVNTFSFAFSYDVNVSSLRDVSEGRGGPELSIIYIGCLPRHPTKAVFCPRF